MELINGDFNNLKGSFITYAKINEDIDDSQILAWFVTQDPITLEQKIHLPPDLKAMLNEGINESRYFKTYLKLSPEELNELSGLDEDLLSVGEFDNLETAERAINLGIDYYFLRYKKVKTVDSPSEKQRKPKIDLSLYKGKLEYVVMQEYALPMFLAKSEGNSDLYEKTKQELFSFSENTPWLRRYVINICGCIEASENRSNFSRKRLYTSLIGAIDKEQFRTAKLILYKILQEPV
ncbi:hypothetical protein COU57_01115 [Candidatus Pacearchaeota archaeon CG10_big_fil_rev_8_21_14_0_10_32_14]|nr:MAG: hypothetical protein COU57_01115 [Candidatus Pacearchaeota archaeon CG10_big_fil_rev_8_21_14_0_10_32_14]